jgi:hypothetical protein
MIPADPNVANVATYFFCDICDYKCIKKFNYNKHLSTLKHKKSLLMMNTDVLPMITDPKVAKVAKVAKPVVFTCDCGKEYKHNRSLWSHKKTCNYEETVCLEIQKTSGVSDDIVALLLKDNADMRDKILEVVKQNQELTKKVVDMAPAIGNTTITNNNQFNINMFLNDECKNAINMTDFIKSIQVSLEQLQFTTNNGLGKGITKVIMDNMNKLSKYERPLHCSDLKREIIYIKENDKWEKDTNKEKLKHAINKASNKNYTALTNWTKENPHYMQQDDKQHYYARTISTIGKPITGVEDKIIKSICKDNLAKE